MLDERRLEHRVPVLADPVGAEEPVVGDAVARLAEVGDDGLGHYLSSSVSRSRVSTRLVPSRPSTTTARDTVVQHRRERVAERRVAVEQRPDGPVRRLQLEVVEAGQREALEAAVGADEACDEVVGRMGEQLLGRVVLGEDAAFAEDRDPVADEDRLVDVVGDEDDRLAQLPLDPQELVLEPGAGDRVEGAEGLVHQHQRRVRGERAREPDALALAARELRRVAGAVVAGREVDEVEQLVRPLVGLPLRPAEQPRHGGDVLGDGHVREEPDLLDHVADPAAQRRLVERHHARAVDANVARRQLDEPVDELHRRRLAAARRADEAADLARRDRHREIVDRRRCAAGVALGRVVEDDLDRLTRSPH